MMERQCAQYDIPMASKNEVQLHDRGNDFVQTSIDESKFFEVTGKRKEVD